MLLRSAMDWTVNDHPTVIAEDSFTAIEIRTERTKDKPAQPSTVLNVITHPTTLSTHRCTHRGSVLGLHRWPGGSAVTCWNASTITRDAIAFRFLSGITATVRYPWDEPALSHPHDGPHPPTPPGTDHRVIGTRPVPNVDPTSARDLDISVATAYSSAATAMMVKLGGNAGTT